MRATLGRWEIATNPSNVQGYDSVRVSSFEPDSHEAQAAALEALAGDFITRHVLERDSVFFEG
ncbi:hypothetical protein SBA4_6970011 [Candidatus Sulfopaludibacter sp. SbA4]|nr:hypothetical protein SBA4_6970011 [Candidatus Sulfopaludibacter sp. SbA4]